MRRNGMRVGLAVVRRQLLDQAPVFPARCVTGIEGVALHRTPRLAGSSPEHGRFVLHVVELDADRIVTRPAPDGVWDRDELGLEVGVAARLRNE